MKLKNVITAIILAVSGFTVMAQTEGVSIKSNVSPPHPSAMLDVESASKGVLTPRVSLQATNIAAPVVSPALSLLVYNTATAGTFPNNVVPGYYFWDGTQWRKLVAEDATRTMGGVVPVGGIIMWSGEPNAVPPGYQLCDGELIGNTMSPLIGKNTPNLQGKFIVGYHHSDSDYSYLGNYTYKDGPENPNDNDYLLVDDKKRVKMKIPAMPEHNHDGNLKATGTVQASGETAETTELPGGLMYKPNRFVETHLDKYGDPIVTPNGWIEFLVPIPVEQPHKHTINGNLTLDGTINLDMMPKQGSGNAVENRPPYYTLAYIIRIY